MNSDFLSVLQRKTQNKTEQKPVIQKEQSVVKQEPIKENKDNYIVKEGDYLSKIARQLGVSTEELIAINPRYKSNPDIIQPGDTLKYNRKETVIETPKPLVTQPNSELSQDRYYTVKSGDSLSKIAKDNNMSLDDLLKLNPNFKNNPNLISIGQQINLGQGYKEYSPDWRNLRGDEAYSKPMYDIDAILNYQHKSNFAVIDKNKQQMIIYDKNRNPITTVRTNTGRDNLDYNTKTYPYGNDLVDYAGNNSTPAGITEIVSRGMYEGQPAYARARVGNNNEIRYTKDGRPDTIASLLHYYPETAGCNKSNGCVRLTTEGNNAVQKYLNIGDRIYTLPQNSGSRFTLRDGQLSFTADNPYGLDKGVEGNTTNVLGKTYDKYDWDDYNISVDRSYQPLRIDAEKTGNREYDRNVEAFKTSLETNKENIQKQLGLSSSEYNSLAQLAMGIAQQESQFGTSKAYKLKQTRPFGIPGTSVGSLAFPGFGNIFANITLQDIAKFIKGDKSSKSQGIAQIKYGDDNDEIKDYYKKIGVTSNHNDVGNEAKAIIARLAHIYKNQYNKKFYDSKGMSLEETLAYLYNGGRKAAIQNSENPHTTTTIGYTSPLNRLRGKKEELPLLHYSNSIKNGADRFNYYGYYLNGGILK